MNDFMSLSNKTESELNKMTKSDIISAIRTHSFMPASYKARAEEMEKKMAESHTNERAACVVLAALVGKEIKRNEYTGQIENSDLNILELVGLVAAKCSDVK